MDNRAQIELLRRLAGRGRIDACKRQLAAAARLYQAEALDFEPVQKAWREVCEARLPANPRSAVAAPSVPPAPGAGAEIVSKAGRRPSLAVMPFHALPDRRDGTGETADGLTHDIITRLAKLRSFFVIAEGSVFALGSSAHRPGRRRPPAQRRLCGQRIGSQAARPARRQRGID